MMQNIMPIGHFQENAKIIYLEQKKKRKDNQTILQKNIQKKQKDI